MGVYEAELPGLDVRKLIVATPRLLTYDVAKVLPRKLAAIADALPGADVPRLVKNVPQVHALDGPPECHQVPPSATECATESPLMATDCDRPRLLPFLPSSSSSTSRPRCLPS